MGIDDAVKKAMEALESFGEIDSVHGRENAINRAQVFLDDALKMITADQPVGAYVTDKLCNGVERQAMLEVGRHLVHGYHPLTHDRDIVSLAELVCIFNTVLPPSVAYFNDVVFDHSRVARRFGALLARAKTPIKSKKACYYIPVAHRVGTTYRSQSVNLWILRNHAKYQKLGPSYFYREYERQRAHADEIYKKMDVLQSVSFM